MIRVTNLGRPRSIDDACVQCVADMDTQGAFDIYRVELAGLPLLICGRHLKQLRDPKDANLREHLDVATSAVAYALRRFQVDPEFAYHMWHTETLSRLIRAYAAIEGKDPTAVRKEVEDAAKALPTSRCAADKEFIDGGGAHGDI